MTGERLVSALSRRPPRLKTLLECPVFGVERPLSNARGIRGSGGGDVTIERRRRDAEPLRNLSYSDVGIGEHRLGGLDVIIGEFRRTASRAASAPRGGKARLGALPDQAALEFRQRAEHVENKPTLRGRRVEGFRQSKPVSTLRNKYRNTGRGKKAILGGAMVEHDHRPFTAGAPTVDFVPIM
jgi:hypothetical protein